MTRKRRRRVELTPAQLCAELSSLCESFAADARLRAADVEALRHWLRDSAGSRLPQRIRQIIPLAIVTGRFSDGERHDLYRATLPA